MKPLTIRPGVQAYEIEEKDFSTELPLDALSARGWDAGLLDKLQGLLEESPNPHRHRKDES